MNNPNAQYIKLTPLFNDETIQSLVVQYLEPYKELASVRYPIKPRRLIGRYLTYLDDTQDPPVSVMINMLKDKPTVTCDCKEFTSQEHCVHIARVIYSLEKDWEIEVRNNSQEALILAQKSSASIDQEAATQKTYLIDHDEENPHKIYKAIHGEPRYYTIKHAGGFDIFNLKPILKKVNKEDFKNKKFKIINKASDGFDVLHQSAESNHLVSFRVNHQDDLNIFCQCNESTAKGLCIHGIEAIYYLSGSNSRDLFTPYLKKVKQKNKLLAEYGLTIDDPEANEFGFSTNYANELFISKIPKRFVSPWMMKEISKSLQTTELFRPGKYETYNYDIGMVLQLDTEKETNFPIKISAYIIERNGKLLKTNIDLEENLSKLSVLPEKNFEVLMNFSYLNYKHLLQANYTNYGYSYYSSFYSANIKELYLRYFFSQLEANWSFLTSIPNLKLLQDKTFSKSNLEDIQLDTTVLDVDISIEKNEKFILIKSAFKNSNGDIVIDNDEAKEVLFGRILKIGQRLYLINESPLTSFLATMPVGMLTFPIHFEKRVLTGILLPLSKKFGVVLPENMAETIKVYPMSPSIHVKEFQNSSLIIEPIFYYDQYKFDLLDEKDYFEDPAHPDELIVRDRTDEQNFVEYIRSFHAHFRQQNFQPYFTLPFDLVMKNNWFISFTRDLLAKGVKIVGFNELKKFKYNSNKPDWDMKISSGIDWFDVKIKVSYGDQQVSLKDIRKAIINQQDFIVLDDGSIGILPEEWLNKYAKLFKFSVEEKDGIKISKKQFNIIEMLFNQIDDIEIVNEINEKKQKLLEVSEIKTAPIPSSIQAELRPYQENGYKWMQVLDEISWGGCLADDMGLGKTLQTITFLAYIKEKHKSPTSLIICPTSLIYNWENEINKFAPDLTYYIYYGADRSVDTVHLMTFDVVITSYGIIRNDIEKLSKCTWEYVILDESQAIKNPDALSTKAVQLLQARNRFILSGTPLQNNTYDIFAQFNFLNPGLLGNKEFFKQEFANPIDKSGDQDASLMLRNLIKPFMLRRTKSEVLVDLPEKTETILWCQMDSRQKHLYDEYKEYYRQSILSKIDNDGIAKSGIYILEGLLRLRQICDDPRLVKNEDHLTHKGVKIRELIREIEENTGSHKMLIFSQFTEMLALIREEFDKSGMAYCYLDGSTPAEERRNQVEIFQSQTDIKIFLISLKAGGVGLNLTEADYVYLVDPWWNPAVEQQAIDRAHRIGQKNKIFAYKMICKDSVEEKIIKLQERKLALSKEIVQNDKAFFKSLSKEDIQYLFS